MSEALMDPLIGRPHNPNQLRRLRAEMQSYLHDHPDYSREQAAIAGLVAAGSCTSAGRVQRWCPGCRQGVYSPNGRCPACGGKELR